MKALAVVVGVAAILSGGGGVQAQGVAGAAGLDQTVVSLAHGSTVKLYWGETSMRGELLSVSADSVWLEQEGALRALPLGQVDRIQVQRHRWDGKRVLVWNLIAGLGSTIGLSAACASVEDTSCGSFTLSWLATWAVVGGLAGMNIAGSSHADVGVDPQGLRRFTRFPQGLPESYLRTRR
jgi:hypothetical protein